MAVWSVGLDVLRPRPSFLFLPLITTLGILDRYTKWFISVFKYSVPSRVTSSAVEFELHGFFSRDPANWLHFTTF